VLSARALRAVPLDLEIARIDAYVDLVDLRQDGHRHG
jgi:hypothetical protein